MPNDYCTAGEVQAVLADTSWGATYDDLMASLVTQASRLIDARLSRPPGSFGAAMDSVRYFTGSGTSELWIGELADEPTLVEVAEGGVLTDLTAWATSDYICWPYNALVEGEPIRRLDIDSFNSSKAVWYRYPRAVKITGKWGYASSPPEDIKLATVALVIHAFKHAQQGFADTGAIPDLGQMVYRLGMPPETEMVLGSAKYARLAI